MAWQFVGLGLAPAIGKDLKKHAVAESDRPQFEAARKIIEAELRGYGDKVVLQVRANGHVPVSPDHERAFHLDIGLAR